MKVYLANDNTHVWRNSRWHVESRGLLLEKYPAWDDNGPKGEGKRCTLEAVKALAEPAWAPKSVFGDLEISDSFQIVNATLEGRLIVNHAGGVLENAGLCLHRHFGFPYIPGTAVKGVSRAAAWQTLGGKPSPEFWAVFGWSKAEQKDGAPKDPENFQGTVAFLDAWRDGKAPLEMDIVNCHHPKYYREETDVALDNENPEPHPFLAVETGALFRFAIVDLSAPPRRVPEIPGLPDGWSPLGIAREWLIAGITDLGLGAKTTAGYGWFSYDEEADRARQEQERRAHEEAEAERRRERDEKEQIEAMSPVERKKVELLKLADDKLSGMVKTLAQEEESTKRAFLMLLRDEKLSLWTEWKKSKKGKRRQRTEILLKLSAELGEDLP